jgi:predicted AlkP superfamily pyrophosphatase or phosphodiesterase
MTLLTLLINYITGELNNMKKDLYILLTLLISITASAQDKVRQRPVLVVGIVVDQMRQEYLYRYENKFTEGGFKRLINQGFMLQNAHYNYIPTFTGPGHASVYTGTTPAIHGIIANDFYDKVTRKLVNCVGDPRYLPVGGNKNANGDVSPWRLLSSTITDELRLVNQKRSKVVSLSFKDRGAALPGGHMPNGAYWFDGKSGKFITSTYYMSQLPEWVNKFNQLNLPDKYLSQDWNTFFPVDQYVESGPDDSPYETKFVGKVKSSFPYNLKELRKRNGDYELLSETPYAQDYLTEFIKTAIDGESLGNDIWTDFLAISYSTTDVIGHSMGPNAIEVEDTYIRLDRNIQDLLQTLDKKVGEGNYTVFLTSDHGVAEVPQYLRDNRVPAGYLNPNNLRASLREYLQKYFPGKEVIENVSNNQVFINQEAFVGNPKTSSIDMLVATELINKYLKAIDGIADVFTERDIHDANYSEEGMKGMAARGFNVKRSGDLTYILEPGWMEWGKIYGSTHSSAYSYDTHVPVIFYGNGIKHGATVKYHPITDIAPTLSVLLKIRFPSGCTGQPIQELLE